jgi:hypothetical protein
MPYSSTSTSQSLLGRYSVALLSWLATSLAALALHVRATSFASPFVAQRLADDSVLAGCALNAAMATASVLFSLAVERLDAAATDSVKEMVERMTPAALFRAVAYSTVLLPALGLDSAEGTSPPLLPPAAAALWLVAVLLLISVEFTSRNAVRRLLALPPPEAAASSHKLARVRALAFAVIGGALLLLAGLGAYLASAHAARTEAARADAASAAGAASEPGQEPSTAALRETQLFFALGADLVIVLLSSSHSALCVALARRERSAAATAGASAAEVVSESADTKERADYLLLGGLEVVRLTSFAQLWSLHGMHFSVLDFVASALRAHLP